MEIAGFLLVRRRLLLSLILISALLVNLLVCLPVQAAPGLNVSPNTGAVGTLVTLTGTLFDSYKGDSVAVFFDGEEIVGSPLTVPESGSFTIPYTIPAGKAPGRYWFRVRADAGAGPELASGFFVVDETRISLDINSGSVGTVITVSGTGFYSGRPVNLYYFNVSGESIGSVVASATGKFSYDFAIPSSTGGAHKIAATNAEGNSAEEAFTVLPSVRLSKTAAGPGEILTVTGTGFGMRTNVQITLGTQPVATARTNDYGSFEIQFNIPELKPNPYDITAIDGQGNNDRESFSLTAGASISPFSGHIGSAVSIHGSGFGSGQTVSILYDDNIVVSVQANTSGIFDAVLTIPVSTGGPHTITVTDGTTTRSFTFTVETDAPEAPVPFLPRPDSETSATPTFDWMDVTDLSPPVTYRFQVATDRDFSNIVIDKALDVSEYSLRADEALASETIRLPYFWRVLAVDSASNISEWSEIWSFTVSVPPAPVLLLPASDSQLEAPFQFSWQSVTSLSPPLLYTLQVATDLSFVSVIFEKSGLAGTGYTLTDEDATLEPEGIYYWRVRATDSASNDGAWSATAAFSVASSFTFPSWAIYTLIGIAVIIIGFVAFRVGRRTAYNPPD